MKAPFPWFGGKSRVAPLVWQYFGDVPNYCEPFAGSLAVLLGRETAPRVETVNDIDRYISNFWRALIADPEQVAFHADYPVNEADLHARHRWLVETAGARIEAIKSDPDFYDAKVAGWWVWGQCLWIGSGWCQTPSLPGARRANEQVNKRPNLVHPHGKGLMRQRFDRNGQGTNEQQRPHLTSNQGVIRSPKNRENEHPHRQAKRPILSGHTPGHGVHRDSLRRWQGGGRAGGSGVHAPRLSQQLPMLSGDSGATGRGVTSARVLTQGLYEYLGDLAARLRRVRVCCGDWTRILTPSVTTYMGVTGLFLDPPYAHDLRERCYAEDHDISDDVRDWAIANGDNPLFRIALCGYEGEHTMPESWTCIPWKAHGGYARSERGKANRTKERIWFSPHCLDVGLPFERAEASA